MSLGRYMILKTAVAFGVFLLGMPFILVATIVVAQIMPPNAQGLLLLFPIGPLLIGELFLVMILTDKLSKKQQK